MPYSGSSVLSPRPFYHTGFEKSLERIVLDEPVKEKNIVDKVFSDKSHTLKATIKALFNEIQTRERLDNIILSGINEDICRQHSHLEQVKSMMRFNYSADFLDYFSKAKMHIENNILALRRELREEYQTCFKDLSYLAKGLLSILKDYWNLNSRKSFLNIENDKSRGYRRPVSQAGTDYWQG